MGGVCCLLAYQELDRQVRLPFFYEGFPWGEPVRCVPKVSERPANSCSKVTESPCLVVWIGGLGI